MKDEKKILIICLMFAASIILFTIKASAQTGSFTHLTLKDRYGTEERTTDTKITLEQGKLHFEEDGMKWQEKILLQSKSQAGTEVKTEAGWYLLIIEGERLKTAYLRSFVGADRIYR